VPLYTELVPWILKEINVKGMLFSANNSRATKQVSLAPSGNTSANMPSNNAPSREFKRVPPPLTGPLVAGPYDDDVARERNLLIESIWTPNFTCVFLHM